MIKDGWHHIQGEDVYVVNGFVQRGMKCINGDYYTTHPYRQNKGDGNATIQSSLTVAAFTAGIKRGSIFMA